MALTLECDSCGFTQQTQITFEKNTFIGNAGMNFGFTCPACGAMTEQVTGGDGTYSAGPDGRLVKVADYVASLAPSSVNELAARIAAIEAEQDAGAAEMALREAGWIAPKGATPRERARLALEDVKLFGDALQSIVKGGLYTAGAIYAAFKGLG